MAPNKKPKAGAQPVAGSPKLGADPGFYKTKFPVWRFASFDWDGPWGIAACLTKDWRKHVESHLASIESMTWAVIEGAAGGKSQGTNSHAMHRGQFCKAARDRLAAINNLSDAFFSLRLENTVRIYGMRDDHCLRILWFDPYHFKDDKRAAWGWA